VSAHRKYVAGGVPLDVGDIRNELYGLRNQIVEWLNDHLSDRAKEEGSGAHDTRSCCTCNMWKERIAGVDMSIRRFGGSPRR
jgi:hypothetical protein